MSIAVLEDNCDSSYDEITAKVRQLWQQLPDEDKKQYVDVGKIQVQDLKKRVSERKKLVQKLDRTLQPVSIHLRNILVHIYYASLRRRGGLLFC